MTDNRVSAVLSAQDLEEVLGHINAIKQKMPFLLSLTPSERASLPKAGDRIRPFVLKAMEVASQNPMILPPIFSVEEMRRDVDLGPNLQSVLLALSQLDAMIADTTSVANSEALSSAYVVYGFARASGKAAALEAAVADMKKAFSRKKSTNNKPESEPQG